jgi:processive 1,2-diacylglycerol beta-glucosyltransferase
VARGVSPGTIRVSGIPIDLSITQPKPVDEMRTQHGFALDEPLISLFGGGLDPARVRLIIEGMMVLGVRATLVVVAGRSTTLQEALADLEDSPTLHLHKLGLIDYVDDLVAASDLVITKAGGLIVSEVLARGTPQVLIDPIPGQEEWNADHVVSVGAGIQLRMAESVPRAVLQLLSEPARLEVLRACSRQAARPRAALDIAELVLHDLQAGVHT